MQKGGKPIEPSHRPAPDQLDYRVSRFPLDQAFSSPKRLDKLGRPTDLPVSGNMGLFLKGKGPGR